VSTLGDALRAAVRRIDRLDARLLLEHVTGCTHADLLARPETSLAPALAAAFMALVERRAGGEPLAYLIGNTGFRGLTLSVGPAVLVPRPETELLVELGLAKAAGLVAPRLLDLGTGSGAIALAIKHACPRATVCAVDRSPAALAVARGNGERLGLAVAFSESDWYEALPSDAAFDVIVANPPYVAAGDPHLDGDGLRFEPAQALTDGADGLSCIRAIVAGAPRHLPTGGWLLFEHGYDQASACRELLAAAGFTEIASFHDLAGIERVSGGRQG
jgi:release factor glutamine methyltransferase